MVICYNIEWDCDEGDTLPSNIQKIKTEGDKEYADILSDECGFCVSSFQYEEEGSEFYKLLDRIISAKAKGYDMYLEIDPRDLLKDGKEYFSSYWHGGLMFSFVGKTYIIDIRANGDVEASLFDGEREIASVKDRRNMGYFRDEMGHYIKGDKELYQKEKDGDLIFEYNNWYEGFVYEHDEFLFSVVLDSDNIMEILGNIQDIIDDVEFCG